MTTDPRQSATLELQRGLRVAVACVTIIILLLQSLPRIVGHLNDLPTPAIHLAGWGLFVAVALTEAALAARRLSWGGWRWPAAVAVLATHVSMMRTLPVVDPLVAETSYGVVGWLALSLFFDKPLRFLFTFLGVHVGVSASLLLLHLDADAATMTELALVSVAILAMQVAVGLAGTTVRRIARDAADAGAQHEVVRTRERIAESLHADRARRYEELGRSAGPLLEGLASGSLNPGQPQTQLACAIEAARLRRMFAETDDSENPLVHEVEAAIDVAERRQVLVTLITTGQPPNLPRSTRRVLTEQVIATLATAVRQARVTVIGTNDRVSVSVVCDRAPHAAATPTNPADTTGMGVVVEHFQQDDEQWVRAWWTADPA